MMALVHRLRCTIALVCISALVRPATTLARDTVQFLGLDGIIGNVQAVGINNVGQVVGTAASSNDAFVYDPFDSTFGINGFQNLGALAGSVGSTGSAIGDVAFGTALGVKPPPFATGQSSSRAFFWNGTTMYGLGLSGTGNGIDSAGDVAGEDVLNGTYFAQVWLNPSSLGTLEPFGQTGKTTSEANAVEPLPAPAPGKPSPGLLVGGFEFPNGTANAVGFLYNSVGKGKVFTIAPLPGTQQDVVSALNEKSQLAVGRSYSIGGPAQAFFASTCVATRYPASCAKSPNAVALPNALGGNYSNAVSVNSSGVIGGISEDAQGNDHAVIWRPTGANGAYQLYDLNNLSQQEYPRPGWFLRDVYGIDDHEQILGVGNLGSGLVPFLLSLNRHGIDVSHYSAGAQYPQAWQLLDSLGPYRGLNVVELWRGGSTVPEASDMLSAAANVGDTAAYILLGVDAFKAKLTGAQQVQRALKPLSQQQIAALKFVAIDIEHAAFDPPCTSANFVAWQQTISSAIGALPATTSIVFYTSPDGWSCVGLGGSNQSANPYAQCPLWDATDDNIDDLTIDGVNRQTGKPQAPTAFAGYDGWMVRLGKQYGYDTGPPPKGKKTPEVAALETYASIASLDDDVFDPSIVTPVQGCFGGTPPPSTNVRRLQRKH